MFFYNNLADQRLFACEECTPNRRIEIIYARGLYKMATGSQLFSPFRALGFVANQVPLTLQTQGLENLVTTAVGSAFHVYNVSEFISITRTD